MFGTDCWYRGKYGYAMLNALGIDGEALYGGDDYSTITPVMLRTLANEMNDRFSEDGEARHEVIMWEGENVADDFWYLHDWLMWTAIECDGADAWF